MSLHNSAHRPLAGHVELSAAERRGVRQALGAGLAGAALLAVIAIAAAPVTPTQLASNAPPDRCVRDELFEGNAPTLLRRAPPVRTVVCLVAPARKRPRAT